MYLVYRYNIHIIYLLESSYVHNIYLLKKVISMDEVFDLLSNTMIAVINATTINTNIIAWD